MADLKIQGEVVVDASQAESALDRVGSKAESMAAEVGQSAGQAGRAVDGIGDKADAGAQKFTRAEARMRDAIRKSTLELQQFGKTASEKLEFKLADKGLDASKFQPYLAELRKVEAAHQAASGTLDGMGMSAKATAAALRGVPAQFTDIVTALQGGQRPLTVLMQQGGQLKDMFGGVGAAARALGGYVLGLINPFTIAAAAVGAIALAYNQGSKEQDAFVKSIVTTGNISGVTAGQLGQYARAISSVAGTQSKAAETLAAFVAEGVRGGAMLEKYAQTAIEWENATGQSVAKTAEQFASLQKDPLSSVLKLNEGTNFLTDSVYKQIKALDEQGRSADASKVAMDALNTAMESRSKTIEQNLGYIESAWRSITSAAKKAWDAMLNVGRAETGASQLASLRETLDQRMQRGPINDMPGMRAAWEKGNEGLRKQIDLLAEQERMLRRGAEAEAERNKQLAARIEFDKSGEQYLSKRARMEREIAKATNEAAAAGVGQAELEQRIASIREKFAEKNTAGMKAQRAAAKLLAEDMAALAKMAGLSPDFYKEWDKLNDMFKRGKLDAEGLTNAQAELLKKQPVIAAETKAQADAQKQVNASIDAYRSALQAVAKEEAARVDGIAKSNADLREQIATMGLTNQQIRARTIELNRATIAEKEQQLARLQSGYTNTREQAALEEEIRLLKERNGLLSDQGVKEQYVAAQQEMAGMWQSIDSTAHDVFVNIFEDGAGTFKRLGQTLKSALLDMLYQLTVKRWIINIGASFGATGGIFGEGQGGAGSLLGTASNLNTAWGMLSGTGGNMGALTGLMSGSMSWANALGSVYANTTGTGISGLLATNGAYGTAGGAGAGLGATAAGIAAIAAPLIIGSLIERNSRDRFSGAAYATSGGNDPFVRAIEGSTDFNYLTGDLPDRAALLARLEELGAPMQMIGDWNDRALTYLMESAADDNSEFGINWTSRVRDMRDTPDFYRGAGYAHPEELGWWNNKDNANLSTDPALIQASRDIALSIIGPLEGIGALIGDEAAYRATVGFANRGEGNGLWAGLNLQRDGQNVADWVNTDDFHSVGEAVRAMYSTALGTLDSFDLPGWADRQVTDARAALDALDGENMGQEAAALYAQTTAGIEEMYRSIQMLIDVFPDFSAATQDSVYALAELMGGMDNLQSAYSTYIGAFWSDGERQALMTAQLTAQLAELGQTMPTTAEGFRRMVEEALAAGEEGNALAAALLGMSGAMAEVLVQTEAVTFGAAQDLAGAIQSGLLGTFDGENLGAFMAQTVSDGIYNAIASGFAAQITDIIVSGVVDPVIQAAITGSSVSAAVSQASIDAMVAQANAVAAAAAAVLNDPAFQEAMASIGKAVGSIQIPAVRASSSVSTYTAAVRESGSAAESAASKIDSAWKSIGDSLMDEVNRIRGVMDESAGQGVDYWQAQFAIAKAQAMAGDQDAAKSLAGISQNLLRAGEESSGSMLELQRLRAQVAQSLQGVAGYAYGLAGIGVQQPTATPPVWTGTTSDGAQYAKPYSPPHTGPGAITNAPIESMAWVAPPTYSAPSGSSNADVVAELRALRQALEDSNRNDTDLQRRTVRVLERMDTLGMPPARIEA